MNEQPITPVLLQKVYDLIAQKTAKENQPLVQQFAMRILSTLSDDDIYHRNESDLYGAVIGLWHQLNRLNPTQSCVKVFNPTLITHGWKSTLTIIEIICPDMQFLVDSIRIALNRHDSCIHLMINSPLKIVKNKQGIVTDIGHEKGDKQAVFHIEIDRLNSEEEMALIEQALLQTLEDVRLVVFDWQPMRKQLHAVINEVRKQSPVTNIDEMIAFLHWLDESNFTFMSYKYYHLKQQEGQYLLTASEKEGLGLAKKLFSPTRAFLLNTLSPSAFSMALSRHIIINKTNQLSRVHRPAHMDYIGVKRCNKKGDVVGEHRFYGFYTSSAYSQSTANIPLIREKVRRILMTSGYEPDSHSFKALANIIEQYPRDELFQATEEEMVNVGVGVLKMQDSDLLRVFIRRDLFGRFFSCMVYVKRERYSTAFRKTTQDVLRQFFSTDEKIEFNTFFSESPLARTHYIVRVKDNHIDVDLKKLECNLLEAATSWDDRLIQAIIANFGESKGTPIAKRYKKAFPRSYKEVILPGSAVADIQRLESLNNTHKIGMLFYRPQEEPSSSKAVKLKLFQRDEPIHLSDVMPVLENLGLRVIGESPYKIKTDVGVIYWILDFSMLHNAGDHFDLLQARDRLQDTFAAIWHGKLENDGFNRLVLNAGLTCREVMLLRAYARYMRQVSFPFSQTYIEDTLLLNAPLTALLVQLFNLRFEPTKKEGRQKAQADLIAKINKGLDKVENLDDDRIIRRYMEMICATLRTNYFQLSSHVILQEKDNAITYEEAQDAFHEGEFKPYLSLKLNPQKIPEMPKPIPEFEIFVYSPDLEGVHLRAGKIARGGLRWSDRQEDFRTEILGLVKAQQVKNTVIVPVGAKGGFVCKKQQSLTLRDEIFNEGKRCYCIFIQALLDVTDNIKDEKVVPPANLIRYDDDDPYLVVAADKGTATFSDLANRISLDYQFWLGDAFASGGSNGYDHKAMGITAKGAFESVKRHFRELGINCQKSDFTCVGIGDMSGDVFGNGMLLSKHILLVAAFNHQHIFIDPTPDPVTSFKERQRLFKSARSSWDDYDKTLISKGGGVFSRKTKAIKLTPQIQTLIGTKKSSLTPNQLIQVLLKLKVDLLWNGGIGTYVKARGESHLMIGDRANDGLRVNGDELGAKIVGEGGNLGLTQQGRIEFALAGGRVNTDFIDNVGGVDCSDNEVNIKILLNYLLNLSEITMKQRNALLESMASEVEQIVLSDAYLQSGSLAVTVSEQCTLLKDQIRFIHYLEKEGKLDRQLEHLADDDTLLERLSKETGLTQAENAVLLAYAKMGLKEQLVVDEITKSPYFIKRLPHYFPQVLQDKFPDAIQAHPLRKEIIATMLANEVCNEMGAEFVHRMNEETGAGVSDIITSYAIIKEIVSFDKLLTQIQMLDNKITASLQSALFFETRKMMRRATRWLLRNPSKKRTVFEQIAFYKAKYQELLVILPNVLVPAELEAHQAVIKNRVLLGVPDSIAIELEYFKSTFSVLDIADLCAKLDAPFEQVAKVYFQLGARLSLHWFLGQINAQKVENYWQGLARASFREDLDWQQRLLTAGVIETMDAEVDIDIYLDQWVQTHKSALSRWESIVAEFRLGTVHEFAKFSVALRELALLNVK